MGSRRDSVVPIKAGVRQGCPCATAGTPAVPFCGASAAVLATIRLWEHDQELTTAGGAIRGRHRG
jgi:hypothetical protein